MPGCRCLVLCWLLALSPVLYGGELTLVDEGKTSYRIYHAPDAPPSVIAAAKDLTRCVLAATGVNMPISNGVEAPQGPCISLGVNAASLAVGITGDDLPPEAFRIVTKGDNVYILGPDTPQRQTTAQGGTSSGTANGVYSFLEQALDVRWLMPGDLGEDVPTRSRWIIGELNITQAPAFANRRLPYIQNRHRLVQAWSDRMKLGYSLRLNHGHNWAETVPPALFDQHPDWFAMQDGRRVPPVGRYKLETTSPQLVDFYAQRAAEALQQNPSLHTYSLSPSDSGGWSTSEQSRALMESDPNGKPSNTPLVLDFYIRVAHRLKQLHPSGAAAGYIYASYLYPPSHGIPPLPDNLYLIVAPNFDYGYRLYRDDIRQQFEQVMGAWSAASDRIGFYDLPNNLSQSVGAPEAPGLDILAFLFPRLQQAKVKSVYIYGQDAWGTGAMSNYLLARLMWDAALDPRQLADEYCLRAYGPSAGPFMRQLYDLLDQVTAAHYVNDREAAFPMTNTMLQRIYGDHYTAIEALFLKAHEAAGDLRHRQRLALFEQNLILLQWNLRQRRMVADDTASPLYRNDEQVLAMLSDKANELALSPGAMIQSAVVQVQPMSATVLSAVTDQAPGHYLLRGSSQLAFYPLADEEVIVTPSHVTERGELLSYVIVDSMGKQISTGLLRDGQPIRFIGDERQLYYMNIQARVASYRLAVQGAPWALNIPQVEQDARLHFLSSAPTVYFHVEQSSKPFTITLSSASPGETAAGEVVSPSGQVQATLDTSAVPADRRTIAVDEPGIWQFRPTAPKAGNVDDVFLSIDGLRSPWVSLDGRTPLLLRAVK